jgi:hypothetical protein
MSQSTLPAVELLWEKYSYNPFTGTLHKRKSGIHVKGFGTSNKRGWCIHLTWHGKRIQTSYGRVVYAWCTGAWPIHQIDHINRNPQDNRIQNLRDITNRENCQNRANFGHWLEREQRWQARIRINGKLKYLGRHKTREAAQQAYREACQAAGLPCLSAA